jgi:peptidyl-prolyl cis-trans isomerase SurA
MKLILRTLSASAALFLLLGMFNAAFGQGKSIDRIVAKVDNYVVLRSDVEALYNDMQAGGVRGADRCGALQQLIIQKVLIAKAEIDSVVVEDKEIEDQLNRRMEYMIRTQFGSEQKLQEAYGKTVETLKGELRKQVREQAVAQKMQETITGSIKITPSQVKRFYNNLPKDSIPYFPTEVEVGQIVKVAKISREQKNEVRAQLNKIRDRVIAGEDFAVLAKQFSQDPGSAQFGGNLGVAKRGMMVPEFEAMAFKLKINEISQVFETEYGFHILQLLERKGEEYTARHILIRPSYSQVDLNDAERFLDSLRTLIVNDSLTFTKAAKEHSEDKATASRGGMIMDESGSSKIFTEALDPVIFFTIDTMQVGNVSKPIAYRTDDGKSAMRILYYKSKIAPHQANLQDDWQKIYDAALNERKTKALNEWFAKAKDEVFINIDEEYGHCKIMSNTPQ